MKEISEAANRDSSQSPLAALVQYLSGSFPPQESATPMARFLTLDGKFDETLYASQILYIAKRLVMLAQYSVSSSIHTDEPSIIRNAIESAFDTTIVEDPELLFQLVYECYRRSKQKLTTKQIKDFVEASRKKQSRCYICGTELDFDNDNQDNYCQVEHFLPRSLGGGNDTDNLRLACKECNGFKQNLISGPDLHYERLVYPTSEEGPRKITKYHIFASRFFHKSVCSLCGKPTQSQGQLTWRLGNADDAWHLFNIELLCGQCQINQINK